MDSIVERAKVRVRSWTDAHPHVVLYDEENATLLDVASGKQIRLSWRDMTTLEEKVHPETGDIYLVLLFEDGRQIALVDPGGVAFAPSTVHSRPVENWPAEDCFLRHRKVVQRR